MRPRQAQSDTTCPERKVPTSRFFNGLHCRAGAAISENSSHRDSRDEAPLSTPEKTRTSAVQEANQTQLKFSTRGGSREPTEGATCALTGLTTPDLYRWRRPPSPARNGGYSTLTRLPIDALTGSQASGYGGKGPVPIAHGSALRSRALHAFKAPFQLSVLLITRILPPEVRSSERWFFAFAAHFGFDFSEHAGKRRPLKSGYV